MKTPGQRTRWGLERGNIDLTKRPVVKNKDGSISTVASASSRMKGKEVLFPTVVGEGKNAKIVSVREAAKIAAETGKHLGKFRTPAQADQYARTLHKMQDKMYGKGKK